MMKVLAPTILFLIFLFFACKDKEQEALWDYEKLEKGAYVRLLDFGQDYFDIKQPEIPILKPRFEFVDSERGNLVEQYRLEVAIRDQSPQNGDQSKDFQFLKQVGKREFSIQESGNWGLELSLKLTEIIKVLNLELEEINQADEFYFKSQLVLNDGRIFSSDNSSISLSASAFENFFDFQAKVFCLISEELYTGAYTIAYVGDPPELFGGTPFTRILPIEIELSPVENQPTVRRIYGIPVLCELTSCHMDLDLEFRCGKSYGRPSHTNLRCREAIYIGQGQQTLPEIDLTNDSVFYLNLELDMYNDCGAAALPFQVKFTKLP